MTGGSRSGTLADVKPAIFHAKAREALRRFPKDVRRKLGAAIDDLQHGATLSLPLSRPIGSVGQGVQELRVRGIDGAYRAFYLVKTERGVIVFHAFQKKTQKTPKQEIELGRRRLGEVLGE